MHLTKLEQAITLATILNAIGEENIEDYVELEALRPVVKALNKFNKKTKPEEKKKAIKSIINKMMNGFTKEIEKDTPPFKNEKACLKGTERGASCNTQVISREPPTPIRKK